MNMVTEDVLINTLEHQCRECDIVSIYFTKGIHHKSMPMLKLIAISVTWEHTVIQFSIRDGEARGHVFLCLWYSVIYNNYKTEYMTFSFLQIHTHNCLHCVGCFLCIGPAHDALGYSGKFMPYYIQLLSRKQFSRQ